jgi:hypothetical protein
MGDFTDRAKDEFAERGGADAAKEDAQELKDAAGGEGSLADKAREGGEALKDPGAPGDQQ